MGDGVDIYDGETGSLLYKRNPQTANLSHTATQIVFLPFPGGGEVMAVSNDNNDAWNYDYIFWDLNQPVTAPTHLENVLTPASWKVEHVGHFLAGVTDNNPEAWAQGTPFPTLIWDKYNFGLNAAPIDKEVTENTVINRISDGHINPNTGTRLLIGGRMQLIEANGSPGEELAWHTTSNASGAGFGVMDVNTNVHLWRCEWEPEADGNAGDFPSAWLPYAKWGDVNGDGIDDIATAFIGNAPPLSSDYSCPARESLVANINGDTWTTFVLDGADGAVIAVQDGVYTTAVVDLNGDGRAELVAGTDLDTMSVYAYAESTSLAQIGALSGTLMRQTSGYRDAGISASTSRLVTRSEASGGASILTCRAGDSGGLLCQWETVLEGALALLDQGSTQCSSFLNPELTADDGDLLFSGNQRYCILNTALVETHDSLVPAVRNAGSPHQTHVSNYMRTGDLDSTNPSSANNGRDELFISCNVYDIDPSASPPVTSRFNMNGYDCNTGVIFDRFNADAPHSEPRVAYKKNTFAVIADGQGAVVASQGPATGYYITRIIPGQFTCTGDCSTSPVDIAIVQDTSTNPVTGSIVQLWSEDSGQWTLSDPIALTYIAGKNSSASGFNLSAPFDDDGDGRDDFIYVYRGLANAAGYTRQAIDFQSGESSTSSVGSEQADFIAQLGYENWVAHNAAYYGNTPAWMALAQLDDDADPEMHYQGTTTKPIEMRSYVVDFGSSESDAAYHWTAYYGYARSGGARYAIDSLDGVAGEDILTLDGSARLIVRNGQTGAMAPGYPVYLGGGAVIPNGQSQGESISVTNTLLLDITGDGSRDLVVGADDGYIYAIKLDPTDGPSLHWSTSIGVPVWRLVPADADGDGKVELIAYGGDGRLYGLGRTERSLRIDSVRSTDVSANGGNAVNCQGALQALSGQLELTGTAVGFAKVGIRFNGNDSAVVDVSGSAFSHQLTVDANQGVFNLEVVALGTELCDASSACECFAGQRCADDLVSVVKVNVASDADSDGIPAHQDCPAQCGMVLAAVGDSSVTELCDNLDNDCNGVVDDAHPVTVVVRAM